MLENLTKKNVFCWQRKEEAQHQHQWSGFKEGKKKENLSKKTHFKQGFSFGESEVSVGVHFEKTEVVVESSVNWFC